MANINFSFGIQMDKSSVKQTQDEIKKIIQYFQREMAQSDLGASTLNEYKKHVKDLDVILKSLGNSYVNSLEKFNVSGFEEEVRSAGVNLAHVLDDLEAIGVKGSLSFDKFTSEVKSNRIELEKTDTLLDKTVTTLTKTYLWNMANRAVDVFNGKIQDSVKFIYDLDESLNNIQVVTGKSSDEMATFAKNANEAAQRLGQTTLAYTEGALLYLQQGKTMEEANYLTEATLVGASITGEDSAEVAELLTASLNGYSLAAENAMNVTDKFAAVGAATGSSFYELATAFSKTASMASTVGVEFDQLTAQIATIATVTRETPETIGTSLKTVYARMAEITMGGSDGEYDFGAVKSQLEAVGISIVDSQNNLRDMGQVIEEIGEKWDTFGRNAQVAIANAMGGKLQANRLLALFNNWEMYQDALTVSMEATGAAEEQNAIRLDSLSAKTNQLRAATEELYMTLLDSDGFKVMVEGATLLVQSLNKVIELMGGLVPILSIIGPAFLMAFGQKVVYDLNESIITLGDNIKNLALNGSNLGNVFKPFKKSTDEAVEGVKAVQESIQELNAQSLAKMDEDQFGSFIKTSALSDESKQTLAEQRQEYSLLAQEIQKTEGVLEGQIKAQEILQKENITATEVLGEYRKALAGYYGEYKEAEQAQQNNAKLLEELNKDRENNIQAIRTLELENEKLTSSYVRAKSAHEALNEENKKLIKSTGDLSKELEELNNNIHQTENNLESQKKSQNSLGDSMEGYISRSEKAKSITEKLSKAMAIGGVVIEATSALKQLKKGMEEVEGQGKNLLEVGGSTIGGAIGFMLFGPMGAAAGMGIGKSIAGIIAELTGFQTSLEKAYETSEKFNEELSKVNSASQTASNIEARKKEINSISDLVAKQQEQIDLMNLVAETFPELVKGYDLEGNAIVDLTQDYEAYAKAKKDALMTEENIGAELKTSFDKYQKGDIEQSDLEKKLAQLSLNPILEQNEQFKSLDETIQKYVLTLFNYSEVIDAVNSKKLNPENVGQAFQTQLENISTSGVYEAFKKLNSSDLSSSVIEAIKSVADVANYEGEELSNFIIKIANSVDNVSELTVDSIFNIGKELGAGVSEWKNQLKDGEISWKEFSESVNSKDMIELKNSFIDAFGSFRLDGPGGLTDKDYIQQILQKAKDLILQEASGVELDAAQTTFLEKVLGLGQVEIDNTVLKAAEAKAKIMEEFERGYENPLSFATAGELDETIDAYQSLIEKNELLVELFNEGNDIEWKEGHPFSQSFAEIIDGNVESAEELAEKSNDLVLTLNEMFEDVAESGGSLTEFFDEDMANAIQSLVDNTELIDLPFAEWPDQMKDTLAEVYNHFADFETNAKSMYISLQATNEEFYKQLREDNAETFAQWDQNFGLSGESFKNMAEYQAAVDAWKYQQLSQMSNEHLEFVWKQAVQEGLIDQQTANEELSLEDKKFILMGTMNKDFLTKIIDGKIKELEAEKEKALETVDLTEGELNSKIHMITTGNDILARDQKKLTESVGGMMTSMFHKSAEGLRNMGITVVRTNDFTVKNTYTKTLESVKKKIDGINASIAELEGYKKDIEEYEGFNPGDLNFDLPTYNPTNSPTTSSGGYKPSSSSSGSGGKGSGGKGGGGKGSGSCKEETEIEVEDL